MQRTAVLFAYFSKCHLTWEAALLVGLQRKGTPHFLSLSAYDDFSQPKAYNVQWWPRSEYFHDKDLEMVTHSDSAVQSPGIITKPTSPSLADDGTARTRIAFWGEAKIDGKVWVEQFVCIVIWKTKGGDMSGQKTNKQSQSWIDRTSWEENSSLTATGWAVQNNVSQQVSKWHLAEMNRQRFFCPVVVPKWETQKSRQTAGSSKFHNPTPFEVCVPASEMMWAFMCMFTCRAYTLMCSQIIQHILMSLKRPSFIQNKQGNKYISQHHQTSSKRRFLTSAHWSRNMKRGPRRWWVSHTSVIYGLP